MNTLVKTGCTVFYMQTYNRSGAEVAKKQRSRFTPSLIHVQLVWIIVKIVPLILVA